MGDHLYEDNLWMPIYCSIPALSIYNLKTNNKSENVSHLASFCLALCLHFQSSRTIKPHTEMLIFFKVTIMDYVFIAVRYHPLGVINSTNRLDLRKMEKEHLLSAIDFMMQNIAYK